MSWIDQLRDMICQMYEAWGGDCANLGGNAQEWHDTVRAEYDANGVPASLTQQMIDDLETHLAAFGNNLSSGTDADYDTFVSDLNGAMP